MFTLHTVEVIDYLNNRIPYHTDYAEDRNTDYARKAYECWHNNPNMKGYVALVVDGVVYPLHTR